MNLLTQIKQDFIAHDRNWTSSGFHTLAVHRFGKWRMKIKPKILRAPFSIAYKTLNLFCKNIYNIELPENTKVGENVKLEHFNIVIHGNAVIGDNSIIRQNTTIGNRYLDKPFDAPKLGNNVNVGANAIILGNVVVGDNVNVGAGTIVLTDVPDDATIVSANKGVVKK